MAMNMMGLGFAFGAKDKGLGKMVDKTTKGIGSIAGMVKNIGAQASKFSLGAMFAIPSQALNTMQTIASDTRVTTTSVEEFGIQADKATRKAIVGLNLTTGEAKKARKEMSGVAYSTGIDLGTITESWKALGQNQMKVSQMGFKNFKEYSKFLQVTNTDSKEFAATMGHAHHTLGMTDKEMQDLVETTLALGKQMDQGAEAVPSMIKKMKIMRESGAALFDSWGKEKTTKFLYSTQLVQGALQKSGMTFEAAEAASGSFLTTLMKGKESFSALYTGIEKDLGPLAQMLSENFLGPQEAFELLEKSPHEFMLKMTKATDQIGKLAQKQIAQEEKIADVSKLSGDERAAYDLKVKKRQSVYTARFSQQMSKLMGSDMTTVFMKESGKVMKQVEELGKDFDKVGGKKGAIARVAKEFRTGRSPTVDFARAQALLVTQMKHLKGTMSDGKFLKTYNKSSKLVMGTMREMANKGGPVAKAMTTLIDFTNFGLGGVLSQLHPMGPALTTVMEKFAPYLQMLPALAVGFKALFSPLTLIVAAIGGIYLALKYPKEAQKAFAKFAGAVEQFAPKIIGIAKDLILGVAAAIARVFVFIWDKIDWGKVKEKLIFVAGKIGEGLKWALLKVLDFASMLIEAFGNINYDTIRKYLTIGFKYAFYAVVLAVGWVLKQLPSLFKGAFKIVYAVIFSFFDGIRDAFKEQFPILSGFFDVFFAGIKYGFTALITYMAAKWVYLKVVAMKEATVAFIHRTKLLIKSKIAWAQYMAGRVADYAVIVAKAIWAFTVQVAKTIWWVTVSLVKIALVAAATYALYAGMVLGAAAAAAAIVIKFGIMAVGALIALGKIAVAAIATWIAVLGPIAAIILAVAAIGLAIYVVVKKFKAVAGFFKKIGKKIVGVFKWAGGLIKDALLAPLYLVKAGWNKLKGAASSIWGSISGVFSGGGKKMTKGFEDDVKKMSASAKADHDRAKAWLTKSISAFSTNSQTMSDDAKKAANGVVPVVGTAADRAGAETVRANAVTAGLVEEFVTSTENHIARAEKLAFGGMKGEVLSDLDKYRSAIEEIDQLNANIGDDDKFSKKERKRFKERKKMLQEQMRDDNEAAIRNKGMSLDVGTHYVDEARRAYEMDTSMFSSMTFDQQKEWKKRAHDQRDFYARSRLALGEKIMFDSKNEKQYRAELKALDVQMMADKNAMFADIAAANQDLEAKIRSGQSLTAAEAKVVTNVMLGNWTAAGDEIKKQWADKGDVSEAISEGMDSINASYTKQMLKVKNASFENADDRIAALLKVTNAHKLQRDQISQFIASNVDDIKNGSKSVQKDLADRLKVVTDKIGVDMKKAGKEQAKGLKKVVAEEFTITGGEAAGFLRDLAGIRPTKFKKDLKKLRISFENFLKKMEKTAVKLIAKTNKKMATHREAYNNYWKKIEQYTNDYTAKILKSSTGFWKQIISLASSGTNIMIAAASALISTLETKFRSVNILDILTSGGKIHDWALRIVRSLDQAFKGTNPFDTAINIAARKSSAIVDAMARDSEGKGTVTPIGSMTRNQRAGADARNRVKDDLIAATNNPAWSEKVKAQNETTNRILSNGFRALIAISAGGQAGKRAARNFDVATIDNQGDGIE